MDSGVYSGSTITIPDGVTLRAKAYNRVKFDGIDVYCGNGVRLWGVEIYDSLVVRWTDEPGSNPTTIRQLSGTTLTGSDVKLINCYIHDTQSQPVRWYYGGDGEVHGCVFAYQGWNAPDRPHAPTIYTHNGTPGSTRRVDQNVILAGFSGMFQVYSATTANTYGYWIENNALFGKAGTGSPLGANTTEITFQDNHGYSISGSFGYSATGGFVKILRNRLYLGWGGYAIGVYNVPPSVEHSENELYNAYGGTFKTPASLSSSNNAYWRGAYGGFGFTIDGVSGITPGSLPGGWETGSTFNAGSPTVNKTVVHKNRYEDERGLVIIWNWEGLSNVLVDLSSLGLVVGETYRAHSAMNYMVEWHQFVYDGNPVSIPMTGWTRKLPINMTDHLIDNPNGVYNAFIVVRAGILGE